MLGIQSVLHSTKKCNLKFTTSGFQSFKIIKKVAVYGPEMDESVLPPRPWTLHPACTALSMHRLLCSAGLVCQGCMLCMHRFFPFHCVQVQALFTCSPGLSAVSWPQQGALYLSQGAVNNENGSPEWYADHQCCLLQRCGTLVAATSPRMAHLAVVCPESLG
jgi:hypothetical protein